MSSRAAAYRAGSRVVLLVPEQYTLQAERDLLRDLSLPGFFRIDILSIILQEGKEPVFFLLEDIYTW